MLPIKKSMRDSRNPKKHSKGQRMTKAQIAQRSKKTIANAADKFMKI